MDNFPRCSHHTIGKEVRPPKNFSLVGIRRSRFEFGALGLVLIISPSFELGIAHYFFVRFLILQGPLYQNFKKISQPIDQSVWQYFLRRSTGSSGLLVNDTVFSSFDALFLHGLGPWAPDQFWAVFWIHFGPYFGSLEPTMNPYGSLVGKQVESLRQAACMENEEGS